MRADVVIAGAGIVGLSFALEMASAGRKVAVIERGRAMNEASWAAAGMLAGRDPENPAALRPLSELSLQLYPEYLRRIAELAGREIPFRTQATIQATRRGEKFTGPAALFGAFSAVVAGRRLDPTQVQGYVEGLATADRQFLLLDEQSLDPRDLCGALPLAAKAAGVSIIEETAVSRIRANHEGVEVGTTAGLVSGAEFVDCRGAWAGQDIAVPVGKEQLVTPRKGQMVAVEIADPAQLRVVIRTPELYMVPRGDGRVVIGATVEDAGFEKSVDAAAISRLLADANALWPPLQVAQVIATWAGLRPGSRDDLPLIGATTEPHCWIASGHFRNGILLAPATAVLMRLLLDGHQTDGQAFAGLADGQAIAGLAIAGQKLAFDLDAFSPRRFL